MIALLVGVFLLTVLLGTPVAIGMFLSAMVYMMVQQRVDWAMLGLKTVTGLDSFPFLAVPFFVLAGELMNRTGVTKALVDFSTILVGRIRGGLAHVNVATGMLMAGISGSASADTAALASVFVPAMERAGYPRAFATALSASSGAIGPIIPPSIFMVLIGAIGNVSVGRLFLGGALPGVMMGISLMIMAYLAARRHGYGRMDVRLTCGEFLARLRTAAFPLMIPLIIIGGIVGGVVTPTEAGILAVVVILLIGSLVTRQLTLDGVTESLRATVQILGAVMFITGAANIFAWILGLERMGEQLTGVLLAISSNPQVILLLITSVVLVLGCFVDAMPMLIVLTPILVPVTTRLGVDPVHFGVAFTLTLTIGLLTPPYGVAMYIACAVGKVSIAEFSRQFWPMFVALAAVLLLTVLFPPLVLFLPNLLMP